MGVPRATEWTIRDLLQEELRKRGVKVVPEVSIATPVGRLMPDMVLKNGAEYVVETKLGTVADLLNAVIKLGDYKKYSGAKGAFAVLFPEQLRRPWDPEMLRSIALDPSLKYTVTYTFDDFRPSGSFEGSLAQIADWIARQVLKPLPIEVETSFAIRVLRGTVHYVTGIMRQLKGEQLEDIFGGKTVFENILQYEEGRYPLEQMRQAATYLLINQLLFYHVLARVGIFEPIDEAKIEKPGDLAGYFEQVLEKDYSAVFGFDVASRLPVNATEMVRNVVKIIGVLSPEKIRHDLLGKVFHELIPFEIRKAVAAFYTNNEAAEILAQLAIDKPDAKVMDLAVGSGTLLVAAYRRKRELLQKVKGTIELEDHKRFLEQDLTGIDIMPFAAHLAVVHLSLQTLLYETEKVRVAVWDSTELKPGQTIPAIWSELSAAYRRPTLDMFAKGDLPEEAYVAKGTVTLEEVSGEKIPLEQADLVIMNPPFTRQERLPKDYKIALNKRLQRYEKYLHGQLGLYGYFVFLADRFVKEDGRIAFVLPATVLRVKSAKGVRRLLTKDYSIEHIITAWERAAFSEGAQFREILLVAKKTEPQRESRCVITSLKKLPRSVEEAREYAQKIKSASQKLGIDEIYDDETMTTRVVTQDKLKRNMENLYALISTYDLKTSTFLEQMLERASQKLTLFRNYLKSVKGEILEFDYRPPFHGAFLIEPFRAIKKVDQWTVKKAEGTSLIIENRFTKEGLSVPFKVLKRGLRRPARTDKMDLTDILDYVIIAKFEGIERVFKNTSAIERWRNYVRRRLANLLISRRFDISAKGTTLIAFYSSTPMVGVDMWSIKGITDGNAKILTIWFNSTLNLLATLVYRTETRGAWMKLHEYAMKETSILNPDVLSQNDRKTLLDLFDDIKSESFPSLLQQLTDRFPLRVKIDKAVLKILGFGDDKIDRILDYLYPALAKEIEQLKTLMQG
ncbi:MAG: class I SAM-dependent DNA methyltransferase [Candidatus Bathyarchaeia archaeon]